jgi:hypothetical protein
MDAEISARHRVWQQAQLSITLLKRLARWSGASIASDAVGKISLPNAPFPIAPQRRQPVTAAAMGQRPLNVSPPDALHAKNISTVSDIISRWP